MNPDHHFLFLVASMREPNALGNTEWLAREAALALPPGATTSWQYLAGLDVPLFVDRRHTVGTYPFPDGDLHHLLTATLDATDIAGSGFPAKSSGS